jgi:MFS family permease
MMRSLSARLLALTLTVLIGGAALAAALALGLFERQLAPEMQRKSEAIGRSVAAQLVRALDYGIPLDRLRGVDPLLDQTLRDNAELRYLAVVDAGGRVAFQRGDADEAMETAIPLTSRGRPAGEVRVGVDPGFVAQALAEIAFDVAVVLLVAVLVAFELILFLLSRGEGPARPAAVGDAAAIRLPLFLFVAAEEMSRSFLPLYARELYAPVSGLPAEIAVGLPIAAFMAVVALGQPAAGSWSERLGRRASFLLGAGVAALGLLGSSLGDTLWHLLAARVATGLGYGLVFVACQGHVVDHAPAERRAQAMSVFVGAIMAAAICGPAIGGVLADRLGFRPTLALSAALAVVSAAFVLRGLGEPRPVAKAAPPRLRDAAAALKNVRFLALSFAAAAPAKMILTGFVFYLAPLRLAALGASPAMTGRALMLYGVLMLALGPLAARLADRWRERAAFVIAGGLLSGLAALASLAADPLLGVVGAIATLGVAQALSISAQLALVPEIAAAECRTAGQGAVLGLFRLIERTGSAAGPFVAGALLLSFGHEGAAIGLGAVVATGAVVFAVATIAGRRAAAAASAGAS